MIYLLYLYIFCIISIFPLGHFVLDFHTVLSAILLIIANYFYSGRQFGNSYRPYRRDLPKLEKYTRYN